MLIGKKTQAVLTFLYKSFEKLLKCQFALNYRL